ncbi:MAG: GtrA family protein [Gammaproteobacteria bacterium]|nr:GtrA family protein [Gammaproteobacteria bacterium]
MLLQFMSREFILFLVTGGFAAAVNFGSRIIFNRWMSYSSAIVLAYLAGMITAFLLAKTFVFSKSRHSTARSGVYFTLVNAVAVLQTWGISMLLAYYLLPGLGMVNHQREIAHLVGVAVPVLTSYLGHRHFSFRR